MGIQGLLGFLKTDDKNVSAIKPSHLSEFRGKKAAIDAYSWLHKGVFCCAHDLFLNKPTTKYVDFCLKYIKLLQDHHVTPVLVFDGGRMPFKVVEAKRKQDRQNAKKEANDLIAMGKMNEAVNQMVRSINVTHEMASQLMKAARNIGVESVVAPYEADAQLVYLEKEGIVDFIISEDSDLIIFGAKRVFFKMLPSGHGEVFEVEKIESSLKANRRLRSTFAFHKLLYAAILSGCDYLKNIPGVGLIKAWKFINMTENTNIRQFLKKIPSYLKLAATIEDEYVESFVLSVFAFKYQIVFDTRLKRRVPLNTVIDEDVPKDDYENFLKSFTATELDHFQLALGNIDHKNRQYDNYRPTTQSYLYFGAGTNASVGEAHVQSPGFGFSTEGVYKRARNSDLNTNESPSFIANLQQTYQEDEDLTDLYKTMVTSPRYQEVQKETVQEPPSKRIKCKFLKNKTPQGNDGELVRSRFFPVKDDEANAKTDEVSTDSELLIEPGTLSTPNTEETKFEKKTTSNLKNHDISVDLTNVSSENKVDVVELESDNSNDTVQHSVEECYHLEEDNEEIIDVDNPRPLAVSKSPIIGSQTPIQIRKSKLTEIQNVQKFSRVKKKILGKNQPTLLGFFTKL